MLLLLLAIAGSVRLGGTFAPRDHVLILDTSAWMGARTRQGILLDQAKSAALSYLDRLPAADPVMLVRADALATPVTPFEAHHQVVADAIRKSQPSASALALQQAIDFAGNAQHLQTGRPGEIAFAGAGRVSKEEGRISLLPRISPPANSFQRRKRRLEEARLRRSPASPESWRLTYPSRMTCPPRA